MDLDEYVFYEKKKNPNFTQQQFAKSLGISPNHLCQVKKGKLPLSYKLANKILKKTKGKVDISYLINKRKTKEEGHEN